MIIINCAKYVHEMVGYIRHIMRSGAYLYYTTIGLYQYMTDLLILDGCRVDRPVLLTDLDYPH